MTTPDSCGLWHRLWQLECDYWADVDLDAGQRASEFYTQNAIFDLGGGSPMVGRSAIASFYEGRQAQGPRTSAHIVHNFVVIQASVGSAQTRAYVTLHAATGSPPIPNATPGLVAVVATKWEHASSRWLIAERTSRSLFVEPGHHGPTTSPAQQGD